MKSDTQTKSVKYPSIHCALPLVGFNVKPHKTIAMARQVSDAFGYRVRRPSRTRGAALGQKTGLKTASKGLATHALGRCRVRGTLDGLRIGVNQ
jgi:hypothetical protein